MSRSPTKFGGKELCGLAFVIVNGSCSTILASGRVDNILTPQGYLIGKIQYERLDFIKGPFDETNRHVFNGTLRK